MLAQVPAAQALGSGHFVGDFFDALVTAPGFFAQKD
jgi:hypothetical protein